MKVAENLPYPADPNHLHNHCNQTKRVPGLYPAPAESECQGRGAGSRVSHLPASEVPYSSPEGRPRKGGARVGPFVFAFAFWLLPGRLGDTSRS